MITQSIEPPSVTHSHHLSQSYFENFSWDKLQVILKHLIFSKYYFHRKNPIDKHYLRCKMLELFVLSMNVCCFSSRPPPSFLGQHHHHHHHFVLLMHRVQCSLPQAVVLSCRVLSRLRRRLFLFPSLRGVFRSKQDEAHSFILLRSSQMQSKCHRGGVQKRRQAAAAAVLARSMSVTSFGGSVCHHGA